MSDDGGEKASLIATSRQGSLAGAAVMVTNEGLIRPLGAHPANMQTELSPSVAGVYTGGPGYM